MSNDTEPNFNLDLQEHFLTSFHNGMRDFAKELDKKREVKVLESVKKAKNTKIYYDNEQRTKAIIDNLRCILWLLNFEVV